ncbi:LOW QUALITY PROTEIN: uncharacterized protein LOC141738514 [Larus michahellis]|uniref:LOW QUALITY PROTEIN: uncharacterized protein LOC141738514 n=1 Tax=Larus michahellis TaxID=119627 RepID=UPI003D9AD12C
MAGWRQELVTFEDIAIYLSRTEYDAIEEEQRELYRSVMLDNYKLLMSLGYPGPKPDILYRLENGEEPWVCTSPSPVRWDGPDSPSPGHEEDRSRLEEPLSDWWPGASEHHVPEEGTETPCQAGGRCTQWRLRSRRLLKKFGCLGDRSELPAEVASTGVGPAESRDQAQTVLWPGKEGEVEDKREVTANVSQSRGFPLHPVPEQQNKKANPQEYRRGDRREKFQRGAPKSQCPSLQGNSELSVEELNETIFKDHCYCVLSEAPLVCCTLRPCPLREHDYCGNHKDGVWALKDHDYCHVQGIRSQGRVNKIVHLTGKARAVLRRLAARKSRIGRIVRKARRILWHYRPWVNKRLEFPESLFSTSEPPVLPAQAEDDPTKGTPGAFCSPAKREAASPQPRSEGSSQGTMAEEFCVPVVSSELVAAPPPSNAATEVKREATRPEASVRCEAQRAQLKLLQSPDAKQNDEGHEAVNSDYVSLHDAYKMVMRTVDNTPDSVCRNFELGGYSQRKDLWPLVIQTGS